MVTYTPSGNDPFSNTQLGNALTRAILDTIHEPFLVLDVNLRIIVASRSFYHKFQVNKEETQGKLLYEIGAAQYDIPALRLFLKNIIPKHTEMKEFKIVHDFLHIGKRTMLLSAREVVYENSQRKHLLVTMGDITGQELLNEERESLLKQKDLMIKEMKRELKRYLLVGTISIKSRDRWCE